MSFNGVEGLVEEKVTQTAQLGQRVGGEGRERVKVACVGILERERERRCVTNGVLLFVERERVVEGNKRGEREGMGNYYGEEEDNHHHRCLSASLHTLSFLSILLFRRIVRTMMPRPKIIKFINLGLT